MFSQAKYIEKRDHYRMMIKAKVEFKLSDSEITYEGRTQDLCATGVSFVTDHRVKPGSELNVKVLPDDGKILPLQATMKVIRVAAADRGFSVAGEMLDVK